MKLQTILLSATATLVSCAIGMVAQAETVNSRCDIYPRGEDRASKVVNCTFYQRQGNVTIQREDGVTYELTLKGDKYVDQNGKPVTREQDGPAIIFRLAKESVYVYQNERAPSATVKSKSDTFKTVCGVIVNQKTSRYICEVTDEYNGKTKTKTVLRFPDQTIQLIWKSAKKVGFIYEGTTSERPATYSTSEGETDIFLQEEGGKTFFYYSNKDLAAREVRNFKP